MSHPITPSPELLRAWMKNAGGYLPDELYYESNIADQAARWGADQELEACCEYLTRCAAWEPEDVQEMCNLRRPKPPSLKEQALAIVCRGNQALTTKEQVTLRRALEQLDD